LCLSLLHNVKMTYALEHVMLFVSNNNIISSYITIFLYDHHNKIKYEIYLMKHHKYDGLDECLIFCSLQHNIWDVKFGFVKMSWKCEFR